MAVVGEKQECRLLLIPFPTFTTTKLNTVGTPQNSSYLAVRRVSSGSPHLSTRTPASMKCLLLLLLLCDWPKVTSQKPTFQHSRQLRCHTVSASDMHLISLPEFIWNQGGVKNKLKNTHKMSCYELLCSIKPPAGLYTASIDSYQSAVTLMWKGLFTHNYFMASRNLRSSDLLKSEVAATSFRGI